MSLETGNYQIFSLVKTDKGPLRLAGYQPEQPLVNDSSNKTFYVKALGGDKYHIQFDQNGDTYLGPPSDIDTDNKLQSRPGKFEWAIDNAGSGQVKVHIFGQNVYWQIPDDAGNQTPVTLDQDHGKTGELWIFKPGKASN